MHIPFPPTLAGISARSAREAVRTRQEKARGQRAYIPQDRDDTHDIAGYMTPDGKVHLVHDVYNPTMPDAAEPGLGTMVSELKHYPNDSSMYVSHIQDFRPMSLLQDQGMVVDETSAAIVTRDGETAILIATDRREMNHMLDEIAGHDILVAHGNIVLHNVAPGEAVAWFGATNTVGGGVEIRGAMSREDLAETLSERYAFIDRGRNCDDFLANLERHAENAGWSLAIQSRSDMVHVFESKFGVKLSIGTFDSPGF